MDARDLWILGAFWLLFTVSRIVWVHGNLATATYWEEEYRWIAALEILGGPIQPLFAYQADHYQGGSLVMILLSAGLMRILGENPAVMKLAAILVSSITLSLLYVVGRRVFGRTAAVSAAAAYLAGPPLVAYWGVIVMGSHGESVAFSLAQILIFYGLLDGTWRTPAGWIALGLVSGLGLWFCYTSGLSLLACGCTWLVLEGRPRAREFAWATGGAIAGLLPWIAYNGSRGFVGLNRIFELFGLTEAPDPWTAQGPASKLLSLLTHHWTTGLLVPFFESWPRWLELVCLLGFTLPLAAALAWSAWRVVQGLAQGGLVRNERERSEARDVLRRELVFPVYAIAFLGVFLGSRITLDTDRGAVDYRFLLPPSVLMLLPAAASFARAIGSGAFARTAASVGLYSVLAVSATATVLGATRDVPGEPPFEDLFGYMARGVLLHRMYEADLGPAFAAARRIEGESARFRTFQGLGWGLVIRFERDGDMHAVHRELARAGDWERQAMRAGMRWSARSRVEVVESLMREGRARGDAESVLERCQQMLRIAGPQPGPRGDTTTLPGTLDGRRPEPR